MGKFERTCWRIALELLIQIALLTLSIGKRNNVIYDMSDELRHARQAAKVLKEETGEWTEEWPEEWHRLT